MSVRRWLAEQVVGHYIATILGSSLMTAFMWAMLDSFASLRTPWLVLLLVSTFTVSFGAFMKAARRLGVGDTPLSLSPAKQRRLSEELRALATPDSTAKVMFAQYHDQRLAKQLASAFELGG